MELEQRVQALEQEVQLLKMQIHATLLDIQEQILTNAYSTLRATDNQPPTNQQSVRGPAPEAEVEAPRAPSPVRKVVLDDSAQADLAPMAQEKPLVRKVSFSAISEEEEDHDSAPMPVVRKVSLDDRKPVAPPPPANKAKAKAKALPPPKPVQEPMPVVDWGELERWTLGKLEKIGAEGTRDLIRMYTDEGQFSEAVQDELLQFIASYDTFAEEEQEEEEYIPPPPPPVVHSRPERRPTPRRSAPPPVTPPVIEPVAAAPVPELPEPMNDYQMPVVSNGNHNGNHKEAGVKGADENEEDAIRHTVLKMIAGIQNVGVNVKWKKRNG